MEMVNGYVFVDLTGENVYKKALGAIRAKKPVLIKDYDQIYFADTIATKTVDDDLVVEITKGGKTITITATNSVSSEGDIQEKIYYYEIDMSDLKIPGEDAGMNPDYCILISKININDLKFSELPIGTYVLIAHNTQGQLDNNIPLFIVKDNNELVIYSNNDDRYKLEIENDNRFTQLI